MATAAYHGLDSNSDPNADPCSDAFYIGEMGMGAAAGDSRVCNATYGCFTNCGGTGNTSAYARTERSYCSPANPCHTYGYWFLLGPHFGDPLKGGTYSCGGGAIPQYDCRTLTLPADCYAWGQRQAQAAFYRWFNEPDIVRTTIWADIEQPDLSGWLTPADGVVGGHEWYYLNQRVIQGWVDQFQGSAFHAGIYCNHSDWNAATNYWTLPSGVASLWCASWFGALEGTCKPDWSHLPANCTIGGRTADLWQYTSNGEQRGLDYDACNTLPA